MICKRGLSEVVTTVLIIALAVAAIILISGFLIPFVRENLDKGKECYDSLGKLSVVAELGGVETCYDSASRNLSLIIKREASDESQLKGIAVSLSFEGEASRIDILNGEKNSKIMMYNKNTTLIVPQAGTEKTYIISAEAEGVQIAPILDNDRLCKETASFRIVEC